MGVARRGTGRRRFGLPVAAGGAALSTAVFSLRNVEKSYSAGGTEFRLTVPRLDIPAGAKVAFVGESGSGKSTLLEMLAMILRPTACGTFLFQARAGDAHDIDAAWRGGERDLLADLRSRHIGYVLQHGGLLPYLTVRQNIELSRRLLQLPLDDAEDTAGHWAGRLNIGAQLGKFPSELSVGQRQRVAIARALVHAPSVLIADEPTAAVDPLNAGRIMDVMSGLVEEAQVTLIVASHAHGLMQHAGLELVELAGRADGGSSMHAMVPDAAA